MDTIKTYLDNTLSGYPQTPELLRLKAEMLSTMEDKYNELKAAGKSENEAVGVVISEFGSIDELVAELNLTRTAPGPQPDPPKPDNADLPVVDLAAAQGYLALKKTTGFLIAIGVALCILAPALLILLTGPESNGDLAGLTALFVLIAAAVGLFVYSGVRMEAYKYIDGEKAVYTVHPDAKAFAQSQASAFAGTRVALLTIGVVLCILSPVVLIVLGESGYDDVSVPALLCFVAAGVFMFIVAGVRSEAYKKLTDVVAAKKANEADRIIGIVASIVWPLTVVTFLVWGLVFHGFHISWILFPVVGILFGAFSAVVSQIKGKDKPF